MANCELEQGRKHGSMGPLLAIEITSSSPLPLTVTQACSLPFFFMVKPYKTALIIQTATSL